MNYAFFLLELMHSKAKALEQLEICEKGKTDFDEQFLIFRYKSFLAYLFPPTKFSQGKLSTRILMTSRARTPIS